MSLSVNPGDALEQAKARQEAAKQAKETAEKAKADAAAKEAEAAAAAEKEAAEADQAAAKSEKEAADVTAAQEKVNAANVRVNTAQQAYSNALNQLSQAQASGDESAIASAQSAVDRAYQELQKAQQEADEAATQLEKEVNEADEAAKQAETERAEAEQAQKETEAAKTNLEKADAELTAATQELEAAEAALTEAEAAAQAEEVEGTQAAEHLSQEEIDKLVQEEGYTYITSKEQFLEIFQNGGIDLNGNYILGCDMDLSDIENWQSVGDADNPFKGVFNGNGYSIDNLTINAGDNAENVGFFGVTENATITNVSFNNANVISPDDYINGSSAVGIVAGTARGTTFDNIDVSGSVAGYESVGGLVGVINDNSYFLPDGTPVDVGNSSISNVNTAVDAKGKYFVGGLAGYVKDTSTGEGVATRDLMISNCNTSGNILFDEEAAGGLIGEAGKTIITINNCESSVDISWNNAEDDSDISFLMETGRAGGFIGCVNGSYIAICNSEYKGNLDVDGDFKGDWYGWYMNDAHVTVYELSGGLPVDDILNIEGIDALTPVTDPATGVSNYQVTVSTLTGLDKMVTMLQANPALADMITFNVNFDFETMDGMYDPSVYEQYGVVQHLYEDEDGTVHNDVYIDNEIDLETTFHQGEMPECSGTPIIVECVELNQTMVSGLYKDADGNYVVNTSEGLKNVNMNFNYEDQVTDVTKRLEADEVRYREYITQMVQYYQNKMYESLRAIYSYDEDKSLPVINKAEYKKLQKMQEAGMELTDEQKLAMAVYEVDYKVMNLVSDTTHNYGCGMGGNASFLDESKAIQMLDEAGRPLFTTLNGDQLRQRMDAEGNLLTDDEGNPVYENLDGSDYEGLAEVFAQRGYPVTDDDGNFLYTDKEGNSVTKFVDDEGNTSYKNADGTDYEGAEEDLKQQLEPYDNAGEYQDLEKEMKDLLEEVESGAY
jgi:GLUG domain protein